MALDRGDRQGLSALKDEVDRAVALSLSGGGAPDEQPLRATIPALTAIDAAELAPAHTATTLPASTAAMTID